MANKNKTLMERLFAPLFHTDITYNNQFPSFLDKVEPTIRADYASYLDYMRINQERKQSYKEYEDMDIDIIAAALDLWADDATQMSLDDAASFYVDCEEAEIRDLLEDLYFHQLHIDDRLWEIVRTFAKYGDYFVRVIGEDGVGVKFCDYSISPDRVTRIDFRGDIRRFIIDEQLVLNPWDIVHFKMPGGELFPKVGDYDTAYNLKDLNNYENTYTYGRSPLYNARRTWKQLNLIEDSLVMLRLSRALKRSIFMVNTTGLSEPKAWELIDRISSLLKKNKAIYNGHGMESYTNLMNPEQDIVLPVTGEKGSINVQELGGDADIQHVADLDYVKNKLYGDLKTPKSYLGFEEGLNGRNTLRMLDVRYARTIKNLQHVLIVGLERIGRIHLSLKGIDPFSVDFRIRLPYISTVEEAEKTEMLSNKLDALQKEVQLVDQLDVDKTLIDRYEFSKVMFDDLGLSEEDISRILKSKDIPPDVLEKAIGNEG